MLVCGDVFEHFAPSAEAERIVYSTLLALRATGAEILVIPGNHDNAKRFAAVERLSRGRRRPRRSRGAAADPGWRRQVQRSRRSSRAGGLPALGRRAPALHRSRSHARAGRAFKEYAEELPRLVAALCADLDPTAVTVLAGHLFVSGAAVGDGERDLTIGQIFAVTPAALPTTVQYIALGHVHRPQDVSGAATPARYAGSLVQLDFGEATQPKSVTVVDVEPGRPPRIRERELTAGRRLVQVRGTLDELAAYRDTENEAWLKVELVCDGPQPGLADDVREILPNALEVRLDYPREDPERRAAELRRLSPRDLFLATTASATEQRSNRPCSSSSTSSGGGRWCAHVGSNCTGSRHFAIPRRSTSPTSISSSSPDRPGPGKTSLLDAVALALYGQVPRMGKQGLGQLVSHGKAEARILLEFAVGGDSYRVARRLPRSGAQQGRFERWSGESWVDAVERGGIKPVNDAILDLVKLDFESFCKAIVLPQGEFARFLKGEPAERRRTLVALLGLGAYERMGMLARDRAKSSGSRASRHARSSPSSTRTPLRKHSRQQVRPPRPP